MGLRLRSGNRAGGGIGFRIGGGRRRRRCAATLGKYQ